MTWKELAEFAYADVDRHAVNQVLVYKDNVVVGHIIPIPESEGKVQSAIWQGSKLHIRTDKGVRIYDDFYSYRRFAS